MKAGLDVGSSLVKAVWEREAVYRFASTADYSLQGIIASMKHDGVSKILRVGNGPLPEQDLTQAITQAGADVEVQTLPGDPLDNEIRLQAAGARKLLERELQQPESFLLVSLGTGTSYTFVSGDHYQRFPLGNSLSGGTLLGESRALGFASYGAFAAAANRGTPQHLLFEELIPALSGTVQGKFVVSSGARLTENSFLEDQCATKVSTVGIATLRDVLILGNISPFSSTQDVVYIGSTINRTPLLKGMMTGYSTALGKKPHFPKHGEFALALGAYLTE
ncbi:hypothetical protein HYT55_01135 [Candidatus Woesearchaeota archaeon]|nr:hypothetical protein [Candidatus Woesearchaeota archaeon]